VLSLIGLFFPLIGKENPIIYGEKYGNFFFFNICTELISAQISVFGNLQLFDEKKVLKKYHI
jgi:hypothetical protein